VHSGALGWNALIVFGTYYFLAPRLVGTELYSVRLANVHFWMALAGTMLYVLSMWGAGVSQGLLWLSLDALGEPSFSFKDIMASMPPYYLLRLVGGLIFLCGTLLMIFNLTMTMKGRTTLRVRPPEVGTVQEST
jgi:cytochrome c oxidase cbb3-type subunit 1